MHKMKEHEWKVRHDAEELKKEQHKIEHERKLHARKSEGAHVRRRRQACQCVRGTCEALPNGGFTCMCFLGYTGQFCQNPPNGATVITSNSNNSTQPAMRCPDRPCENGGRCMGRRSCFCPPEFEGRYCETRATGVDVVISNQNNSTQSAMRCPDRSCENGGRCMGRRSCVCPPGFEGRYCETRATVCLNWHCENGGNCTGERSCTCRPGFEGLHCETETPAGRQCGEVVTLQPGTDESIIHGYRNHDNCLWNVNIASGSESAYVIEADILEADIEMESNTCNYDALYLNDTDTSPIVKLCGRCQGGVYRSTGPSMSVRFRADASVVSYSRSHEEQAGNLQAEPHIIINLKAVQIGTDIGFTQGVLHNDLECFVVDPNACPCMNDGTCNENRECVCPPNWSGPMCESYIDNIPPPPPNPVCPDYPCENGFCMDGFCSCPPNYEGRYCEIMTQDPCMNVNCPRGYCFLDENNSPHCSEEVEPQVTCGVAPVDEEVMPGTPYTLTYHYLDNQECEFNFKTPEGPQFEDYDMIAKVEVINIERNVACDFDKVELIDPSNSSQSLMLCGFCMLGSFKTSGGALRIRFSSDASVVGTNSRSEAGFSLVIEAVPRDQDMPRTNFGSCVALGSGAGSTDSSGSGSGGYPSPTHMPGNSSGSGSGGYPSPTHMPGNSSGSGSGGNTWPTHMPPPPRPNCPPLQTLTLQEVTQTFSSCGYPERYPNNLLQTWNFIATGEDKCIVFSVDAVFEMEDGYDNVTFYSPGSELVKRDGSRYQNQVIFVSTSNEARVVMKTDSSVREAGFSLRARPISCSERDQYAAQIIPPPAATEFPATMTPPVQTPEVHTIWMAMGQAYRISHPDSSAASTHRRRRSYAGITPRILRQKRQAPTPRPVHPYPNMPQLPNANVLEYEDNENVTWILRKNDNLRNKVFRLVVDDGFYTEENFDFLHVFDAKKQVARIHGQYPANYPLALVAGDVMIITFKSDASATARGFNLAVTLVDGETADLCAPNPCENEWNCEMRMDLITEGLPGGLPPPYLDTLPGSSEQLPEQSTRESDNRDDIVEILGSNISADNSGNFPPGGSPGDSEIPTGTNLLPSYDGGQFLCCVVNTDQTKNCVPGTHANDLY